MKMIRAIVRPDKTEVVAEGLAQAGMPSLTKMHVFGRGRTKGIRIGDVVYDEFPKTLLMLVIEDEKLDEAISVILESAKTGTMGDGKVFVTEVLEAYTVSKGTKGL